jgi:DNA-binding protein HU-beta
MNQGDIINKLSAQCGISKTLAKEVTSAFASITANAIAGGESVRISGLGTFTAKTRAARSGRNPRSGATIQIPAKKYVKFNTSKSLSERMN